MRVLTSSSTLQTSNFITREASNKTWSNLINQIFAICSFRLKVSITKHFHLNRLINPQPSSSITARIIQQRTFVVFLAFHFSPKMCWNRTELKGKKFCCSWDWCERRKRHFGCFISNALIMSAEWREVKQKAFIEAMSPCIMFGSTRCWLDGERPFNGSAQHEIVECVWQAFGFHAELSLSFDYVKCLKCLILLTPTQLLFQDFVFFFFEVKCDHEVWQWAMEKKAFRSGWQSAMVASKNIINDARNISVMSDDSQLLLSSFALFISLTIINLKLLRLSLPHRD